MTKVGKTENKVILSVMVTLAPAAAFVIGVIGAAYTAYNTLFVTPIIDRRLRLSASFASGIRF